MIAFLKAFWKRKGHLVFLSTIVSKISGFVLSIFVLRYLTKEEFGFITYAKTTLMFISPFMGFGLEHALLRYGGDSQNQNDKKKYFLFSIKYGSLFSIVLVMVLIALSPLITMNIEGASYYLKILAFSLLTHFIFNVTLAYLRVLHLNSAFSYYTVVYSFTSFFFTIALTYFFKGTGYVTSAILTPLVIFLLLYGKRLFADLKLFEYSRFNTRQWNFVRYGLLIGAGSIASQISLLTDNLLIGNMIDNSEMLAVYRVGSIIPFNLFFVPIVFMTTDFVKIASKSCNYKYLKGYYLNYLKLFGLVSVFILFPILFFSEQIILVIFGAKYLASVNILRVLVVGVVGAFLFRIPLGNILNAVGKAKWNTYNAYFLLVSNLIISYFLILRDGILGAAIASCVMLWLSGLVSLILFLYYLRGIKPRS